MSITSSNLRNIESIRREAGRLCHTVGTNYAVVQQGDGEYGSAVMLFDAAQRNLTVLEVIAAGEYYTRADVKASYPDVPVTLAYMDWRDRVTWQAE